MISRAIEAEILRLYHAERWPIGTIARQLHVHHDTVRRVLWQSGIPAVRECARPSKLDQYLPFIQDTFTRYPTLRASRLYQMVRERGYIGSSHHFRHMMARLRPRPPAEAYLRLRTLPGEQSQVDWAHFGKLTIGRARRPLMAFVMVLSYSRHVFVRFYLNAGMGSFLDAHVKAFEFFGAVPRVCLYDNLKSAVLERSADAIRFNPKVLELAAWYHFQPRPVAVARGNEKGRVERAIRFVRDRFFAARHFTDLIDLNSQAVHWCTQEAASRPCPQDRTRTVSRCFEEERPSLLALPDNPLPCEERLTASTHKTPYVRFDLNDYSVPHTHVHRTLEVLASTDTVRILDAGLLIAVHPRSFDRDQQIEVPEHIAALVEYKRSARKHRAIDRLHHSTPVAEKFFAAAALRGINLGALTRGLIDLLDTHGAAALQAALNAALAEDSAHLAAVRHFIDQHHAESGRRPPIPVALPDDPRVRHLSVRPHNLADYEQLARKDSHECADEHSADPDEQPLT
jgi:transposase